MMKPKQSLVKMRGYWEKSIRTQPSVNPNLLIVSTLKLTLKLSLATLCIQLSPFPLLAQFSFCFCFCLWMWMYIKGIWICRTVCLPALLKKKSFCQVPQKQISMLCYLFCSGTWMYFNVMSCFLFFSFLNHLSTI